MVVNMDTSHVDVILRDQMVIWGLMTVNADQVIDVQGDAMFKPHIKRLGVKFGTVTGDFGAWDPNGSATSLLTTLEGFPKKVGGHASVAQSKVTNLHHAPNQVGDTFYAYECEHLTSLMGSPRWVGGSFKAYDCKLTSLAGAPLVVKGEFVVDGNPLENYLHVPEGCTRLILPYNQSAPILRLLEYPKVEFRFNGVTKGSHHIVNEIMVKYAGQGKTGAIRAAAELIKAGYRENARW